MRSMPYAVLLFGLPLILFPLSLSCYAQFDPGIAAEAMRGTVAAQAAGAMRDNQQLLLDYQNLAMEQAFAGEAARRGLAERLDVQNALQTARRQILVQALREDVGRALPAPTEADLRSAYQAQTNRWVQPAAYQLDVFQVDASDSNALAQARALAGGKPVGDDRLPGLKARMVLSAASGRWVTTNDVAASIGAALPTMKQAEARLFDTPGGLLFIRRGAYREARVLPYEQVQGTLQIELSKARQNAAWNDYMVGVRKQLGF